MEETEELIVRYEQLIKEKEALIADRESQISDKYNDFLERLRISYEDGSQNYLELLISSDSLVDFITRIDNLGSVLTYEQRTMDELEKEVSDLDELKKLRDGSVSEKDSDSSSSEKGGMIKGASADTARHSFPHTFTEGHETEQKKGDNI